MDNPKERGRRGFLRSSGAALSALLVPAANAQRADSNDAAAIRELYREYAAQTGRVLHDPALRDTIVIARDGKSATARFHCLVQHLTQLTGSAPLIEMACLQGNHETRWQSGIHELACVKDSDGWKIQRAVFRASAVLLQRENPDRAAFGH